MNICMVFQERFPPHTRIEKEAQALIKAGHKVYLICLQEGNRVLEEVYRGIKIHRVPIRSFLKLGYFIFNDPLWIKTIEFVVKKYKIEVIHAHNLPAVVSALNITKRNNIPLLFDMHEGWTWLINKEIIYAKQNNFLLGNFKKYYELEKKYFIESDYIILAAQRFLYYILRRLKGIKDNNDIDIHLNKFTFTKRFNFRKVFLIKNNVDLNFFREAKIYKNIINKYKSKFIITYIGRFDVIRNLEQIIYAIPRILKAIPNAYLLLIGDGGEKKKLSALSRRLNIFDKIEFTGWVSYRYIPTYIKISSVCISTLREERIIKSLSFDHQTLERQTKILEYLTMKRPVILSYSDSKLKRLTVEKRPWGIIVRSRNPDRLSDVIIKMREEKEYASKLGERGYEIVKKEYGWNKEANRLCNLYRTLEKVKYKKAPCH